MKNNFPVKQKRRLSLAETRQRAQNRIAKDILSLGTNIMDMGWSATKE